MTADELRASLTGELGRLAREFDVPGVSMAVLIDGELVEAAYGVANNRTGEAVRADTLFMVQSVTKMITATLVMQLVDEGLVGLDDPVAAHLPGFRTADAQASLLITVRHLLTHSGGFEGDLWAATTAGEDALERFVAELVSGAGQHSAPGERFSYSNAGYGTLGRLIEVARGLPYESAVRQFLFEPLGVDEVAFSADEALGYRTAIGHLAAEPGSALRPLRNWAVVPPSNPAAGNQLAMSARALLAFGRMHLAGGDGLLSAASTRRMREPQLRHPAVHGPDSWHGLGWWLERGELVGHGGDNFGVAAMLRLAPRHGVAVAVLTNSEGGGALIEQVLEPVFGALPGVQPANRPVTPPETARVDDPGPYLGRYETRVAGFDVSYADGRLWRVHTPRHEILAMAERAGTSLRPQRHELRPLGDDRFVLIDAQGGRAAEVEFLARDQRGRARFHYAGGRAAPRVD